MDLQIYSKRLIALGIVDEITSLIWTCDYFAVGEIKILAPMTTNNKELLAVGNVVVKHDQYIDYTGTDGKVWRRAAEITYIHYQKDENGQEQIEARGYMLTRWLNQRVITPQVTLTGTQQQIVEAIVKANIGAGAASGRRFPLYTVITDGDLGGTSVSYQSEAYKALGDEVRDQCQQGKLGYDLLVNEASGVYGFRLYKGRDLTADNTEGNLPCIFSRDFDNVTEQEFTHSNENAANYVYVRGASDSSTNTQIVQTVDGASKTGLDLREFLLDATDVTRTQTGADGKSEDIPEATYRSMLTSRGTTELAGRIETYTFSSTINVNSNLKYKTDFDLGDRVTCRDLLWGITIDSRITEIKQTFESGKALIEATFGESSPTLLDMVRKAR